MRWDKVAYLISEGPIKYDDSNNQIREVTDERKIYCNKRNVSFRDKTSSLEEKNRIVGQIEMHSNEYKNETQIKIDGGKYRIIDVSDINNSNILITYTEYPDEV